MAAAKAMKDLSRNAASVHALLDARPEMIRRARAANVSWPDIAEALDVSRVTAINLSKIE